MGTEYAETVKAGYDEWKEAMGDAPAEKPADPAPAPAPEARADAPAPERARDDNGRFTARQDQPAAAERQEPAEPFAGYGALSPEAKAYIDRMRGDTARLTGERDDFKKRLYRQQGNYSRLSQQQNRSAPQSQPAQQARPSREAQAGGMTEARQRVAAMPQGPQRDAMARQLDKWEAHARAYPDDAAAIDQRVGAAVDDLRAGLNPLLALAPQVTQLRQELDELRGFADSVREERHAAFVQEAQATLDSEAGDNWRQCAGWEDADGNPIPEDRRAWHPEFVAWIEGHDPDIQQHYWECLGSSSPRVAAIPYKAFNADRFGLDRASGAQAAAPSPARQQRRENLRDVAPGRARAKAPTTGTSGANQRPLSEYATHIRDGYDDWKRQMGDA